MQPDDDDLPGADSKYFERGNPPAARQKEADHLQGEGWSVDWAFCCEPA